MQSFEVRFHDENIQNIHNHQRTVYNKKLLYSFLTTTCILYIYLKNQPGGLVPMELLQVPPGIYKSPHIKTILSKV
jgi:hypothetical protein